MGIFRTNNPMEYTQVDGIVIDEKAPAPSIQGVGTGVAILVGQFNQGPTNELTEPGSQERIVEMFGNDSPGYNALVNKRFSRLKIIRVNQADAVKATMNFDDGTDDIISFTAKEAGTAGNNIMITIAENAANRDYTVQDTTDTTTPAETYTDVSIDQVGNTFAASQLVDVAVISTTAEPTAAAATALAGGTNVVVEDGDYSAAIAVAEAENSGNVLFLDSYTAVRNTTLATHAGATQDKMVICAGPVDETVAQAVETVTGLKDNDGRIIYAYNWLETLINSVRTFVSPASFMASIISNTSAHIDPAYAANGQFLYGVSAVRNQLSRSDFIQLVEGGIAAFEFDTDTGFKVKSGVVTQTADSSKVTILRRRMADFLANSVGRFLKIYQNAPNSADNRLAVKGAIMDFVEEQEQLGILPRDSEVQGGLAKIIDIDTPNTDESIADGRFLINYRQRLFSSMRYIVLVAEIGQSVVVTEGE